MLLFKHESSSLRKSLTWPGASNVLFSPWYGKSTDAMVERCVPSSDSERSKITGTNACASIGQSGYKESSPGPQQSGLEYSNSAPEHESCCQSDPSTSLCEKMSLVPTSDTRDASTENTTNGLYQSVSAGPNDTNQNSQAAPTHTAPKQIANLTNSLNGQPTAELDALSEEDRSILRAEKTFLNRAEWNELSTQRRKLIKFRNQARRRRLELQWLQEDIQEVDVSIVNNMREDNGAVIIINNSELLKLYQKATAFREKFGVVSSQYIELEDQVLVQEYKQETLENRLYKRIDRLLDPDPDSNVDHVLRNLESEESSEESYEDDGLESRVGDLRIMEERYDNLLAERERVTYTSKEMAELKLPLSKGDEDFLRTFELDERELQIIIGQIRRDLLELHEDQDTSPENRIPDIEDKADLKDQDEFSILLPDPLRINWSLLISEFAGNEWWHRVDSWILHQLQISRWELHRLLQYFPDEDELCSEEKQVDVVERWFDPPTEDFQIPRTSSQSSNAHLTASVATLLPQADLDPMTLSVAARQSMEG